MLPWLSGERFQPARLSSASGGRLYSGWRMRLRCWSSDMLLIRMSKRTGLWSVMRDQTGSVSVCVRVGRMPLPGVNRAWSMILTPVRLRWKVQVASWLAGVVGARCVVSRARLAQVETRCVEASDLCQPELRSPARITALSRDCRWCSMRSLAVSWTYESGLESRRFDLWSQDSAWLQREEGWFDFEALRRLGVSVSDVDSLEELELDWSA